MASVRYSAMPPEQPLNGGFRSCSVAGPYSPAMRTKFLVWILVAAAVVAVSLAWRGHGAEWLHRLQALHGRK